jgi:hypothetical protein
MNLIARSSDCSRLLAHLRAHAGEWVECPHGQFGVVNSRASEIRKRYGLTIDSRYWEIRNGRSVYRYRLVDGE